MTITLAEELKERLETTQAALGVQVGSITINNGTSAPQINSGMLILNGTLNSFETLTVTRGTPDHLGRPFLGLLLEVDQQIKILKGDGIIRLNDHTLTVLENLQEFTGKFVGPGKVQYANATTVMQADQTYEVRKGDLQPSQPLAGSARKLSR